ncbi:MAG: metal ABC transporter permease [Planctomycetota bacterium]
MIPHGVLFAGLALSYNLRVILLGVTALGIAAGVLGAFLLFRRRSLLADTLGHATLPGVVVAFMAAAQLLDGGKPFAVLLLGALISGWFAVRAVQFLRRRTPIREDAALAIVLTVFYGAGVVLLSVVQNLELRGSSGLELYVYGMVASMSRSDAWTLAAVSVAALGVVALLFKELRALSFDEGFVAARGLPHRWLDEVLMSACLVVTIAGLPTVGLLLVMALFIVPPATARLYADTLGGTLVVAGATGAVGAVAGALASARVDHLPAGAAMILATSALFFASLVAAPRRGLLAARLRARGERRLAVESQVLRRTLGEGGLDPAHLAGCERAAVQRLVARSALVSKDAGLQLTDAGRERAHALARTEELVALYLERHPRSAPARLLLHVERIEDVAPPETITELERALGATGEVSR